MNTVTAGIAMLQVVLLVVFCAVLQTTQGERHKMQQQQREEYRQLETQRSQGGGDGIEVGMSAASTGIQVKASVSSCSVKQHTELSVWLLLMRT